MAGFMDGSVVEYLDAGGVWRLGRAAGPVSWSGHDFAGVPVCSETEWRDARRLNKRPETTHRPIEDVRLAALQPKLTGGFHFMVDWDPESKTYGCDCGERRTSATDLEVHIREAKRQ